MQLREKIVRICIAFCVISYINFYGSVKIDIETRINGLYTGRKKSEAIITENHEKRINANCKINGLKHVKVSKCFKFVDETGEGGTEMPYIKWIKK